MSALERKKHELMSAEFGSLPPRPAGVPRRSAQSRYGELTPVSWRRYFDTEQRMAVPGGGRDGGDTFHVYRSGTSGPLLVLLHGGGFSGLTWAAFTEHITRSVECQVLAIDLRGHGETHTSDDANLSREQQVRDIQAVVSAVFGPEPAPPAVLIGHSMGGALAVHAAQQWAPGPLVGLIVIDVVEGTAMDALSSMHGFLRSRPDRFHSVQHAIQWCLKSGAVRNAESARVSVPGQIKNVETGEPATRELADTAPSADASPTAAPPTPAPAADSIAEEDESEVTDSGAASRTVPQTTDNAAAHPQPAAGYTWRIDLAASERHWAGWFGGLSASFLSAAPPKVLLLAGIDRLDRELVIGQMQGKFQLQVMPRCGHAVHEDVPSQVSDVVAGFLVRNRLAEARDGFQPACPQPTTGMLGTLATCGGEGRRSDHAGFAAGDR